MSNETKKSSKFDKPSSPEDSSNRNSLRGWPGYRTRKGRSGYDPVDSEAELGHTLGVFVHSLFTGQLRTKNPFYLVLMAILGLFGLAPFLLAISETIQGNSIPIGAWVVFIGIGIVGIAVLTNLVKNLVRIKE